MKRHNIILFGLMTLAGSLGTYAHDFTATIDGQKLYFNITNQASKTAEVTYKGSIADKLPNEVGGTIKIPAKVKHNNVVYSITAIGAKAFSNASRLTGIVMPSSINRIGDFAFENCSSLSKVVFPGNQVAMGQGTFFKCDKLQDLSFGSDWSTVDLTPYRWSDSLKVISIPPKVERIQNLKSINTLKAVNVDANNPKFSSSNGVLYSKDCKTLYAVPRAYSGILNIQSGTETVTLGAFIDCHAITTVIIPESLKKISFRETSRLTNLADIVFKGKEPIMTASMGGKEYMLFQVCAPKAKVVVLKDAKKAISKALATAPGEYNDLNITGKVPYIVTIAEIPPVKNFITVKNFDKYEN